MTIEHQDLTSPLLGAAIEVHRTLGPGFLESVYEAALAVELDRRSIPFTRQHPFPVVYHGVEVGLHRLDLLVMDRIVVELKAVRELTPEHFLVVRSYLRATGLEIGLILNFAKARLDVRRVFSLERADPEGR